MRLIKTEERPVFYTKVFPVVRPGMEFHRGGVDGCVSRSS